MNDDKDDFQSDTDLFASGDDSSAAVPAQDGSSPARKQTNVDIELPTPPVNLVTRTTADFNIPKTPLKDKYEFLSVLGAGGAGVIYKAKQQPLGRLVAVKMIHSHLMTPTAVKRFHQEATTIGRIAHANIIAIYDFGVSEDNQPFMVMDYVEGTPLSDILDNAGQLSVEETKQIAKQLCDGLAHAHAKGILHRDLKPSNIMMVPVEHGPDVAKILDFGLAKFIYGEEEQDAREHLTKTGETVGTPAFMSPEQVMGKSLDQTSDLYSLGCVMYHCLTGEPPFVGETKMETMLMHLNSKPEPINPSEGTPFISPYLEAIILKLLEKNPADRFQSMMEVKEAIDACDKGLFLTPAQNQTPTGAEAQAAAPPQNTSVLPVPQATPAAAVSQLISYKTLLMVLIVVGLLSIPMMITYIWINAYPSNTEKPVKKKKNAKLAPGADPYQAEKFADEGFMGYVNKKSTSLSARQDTFITDAALAVAKNCPNLRSVDLSDAHKITEKGMVHLHGLNIAKLNLAKSQVHDGVADSLTKMVGPEGLPSLVDLSLRETAVTDALIPTLRLLPRLESLDLSMNKNITSVGANQLGKTGIKSLNLASTMVEDDGMDGIGNATALIKLDLSGTGITDAGVKKLENLNNLQDLNLSNTQITDDALKVLSKLKSLSILNLSKTGITQQSFPLIFKRDQIAWVDISECDKITPVQANEFRHKMMLEGRTVERHESAGH